jgi:hypothetical protein
LRGHRLQVRHERGDRSLPIFIDDERLVLAPGKAISLAIRR